MIHSNSDYKPLKDKVAIITGAGSGIGRATALLLAERGARVGLVDLKENRSESVKELIEQRNGITLVTDTDVSDPERVKAAIDQIVKHWGRLDIVFANAGINGTLAPIENLSPEEWDHTITTNLRSTFLSIKYAIPYMKSQGGSIIITSSINGNRSFSFFGASAYSTSKAGQLAFAKMAALELARYKIRVNVICPGSIETNIQETTYPHQAELKNIEIPILYPEGSKPLEHKAGTPNQVADLVYFLASDQSNHITGTEIFIDGAESLL